MSPDEDRIRRFYDRFGRWQDWQRYEDRALDVLATHGEFATARSVFEFGCGTGRFAARLLGDLLPVDARYLGVDISTTMVRLATERLGRWGERAVVKQADGLAELAAAGPAFDRFVATYVFDLLGDGAIDSALGNARRILAPGGLACLASLTFGATPASRATVALWQRAYAAAPTLVGGCRPLSLLDHLSHADWQVLHHQVVVSATVPSEVVILGAGGVGAPPGPGKS